MNSVVPNSSPGGEDEDNIEIDRDSAIFKCKNSIGNYILT